MTRIPELAGVPKVMIVHCELDKCAAFSYMALLADAITRAGGNVSILRIPGNMASKPNFHCCFWNNLDHGVLRDEFWTPLREHLQNHQYDGDCPRNPWVERDISWQMPSRVAAASVSGSGSESRTDEPVDEEGPSGAPASFDDADAQEDVETSAEKKAVIRKSFEEMKEAATKLAQAPADCAKAQQKAL